MEEERVNLTDEVNKFQPCTKGKDKKLEAEIKQFKNFAIKLIDSIPGDERILDDDGTNEHMKALKKLINSINFMVTERFDNDAEEIILYWEKQSGEKVVKVGDNEEQKKEIFKSLGDDIEKLLLYTEYRLGKSIKDSFDNFVKLCMK